VFQALGNRDALANLAGTAAVIGAFIGSVLGGAQTQAYILYILLAGFAYSDSDTVCKNEVHVNAVHMYNDSFSAL
jgi:hypothetical protein